MTDPTGQGADGRIHQPERVADLMAIQDLATSYAHAVDDLDWPRWQALFLPDAHIDYTSAGGIEGTPAELAAWMPEALSIFTFSMHTTSTHEIRFTGPDTATGRVHVVNRNGVHWEASPRVRGRRRRLRRHVPACRALLAIRDARRAHQVHHRGRVRRRDPRSRRRVDPRRSHAPVRLRSPLRLGRLGVPGTTVDLVIEAIATHSRT